MRSGLSVLAALLIFGGPLAAHAQATTPAPAPAAGAATAPAAPAAKPEAAKAPAVTFTPYGFVLVNAYFNAGAFDNTAYPNYAVAPSLTTDRSFVMNVRQSRLGWRIGLPTAAGADLKATIEFDWNGGFFTNNSVNTYNAVPRVRLAYGTATWKTGFGTVGLLVGQEYGLVAPLFATSLAYTASPLFWNAGNAWHRSPQVRVQGELPATMPVGVSWAVAALNPLDGTVGNTGQSTNNLGPGQRSRMPDLEARVAASFKQADKKIVEVGVAGHWGQERYVLSAPATDTLEDVDSMIWAVDAQVNVSMFSLKGEWFQGENSEDYFTANGVLITPGTSTATPNPTIAAVEGTKSKGGWAQLAVTPIPLVTLTGGYGFEEPEDVVASGTAPGAANRERNEQIAAGLILNLGKNWKTSAEWVQTTTTYRLAAGDDDLDSSVLSFNTQFIF